MKRRICRNCRYWTETEKDEWGQWGLCEKNGKPTQDEDGCGGLFDPKVKQLELWEECDGECGSKVDRLVVAQARAGSSPAILPNIRKTCPCGNEFEDVCMLGGHDHDYCPKCEDEIDEMQKADLGIEGT